MKFYALLLSLFFATPAWADPPDTWKLLRMSDGSLCTVNDKAAVFPHDSQLSDDGYSVNWGGERTLADDAAVTYAEWVDVRYEDLPDERHFMVDVEIVLTPSGKYKPQYKTGRPTPKKPKDKPGAGGPVGLLGGAAAATVVVLGGGAALARRYVG